MYLGEKIVPTYNEIIWTIHTVKSARHSLAKRRIDCCPRVRPVTAWIQYGNLLLVFREEESMEIFGFLWIEYGFYPMLFALKTTRSARIFFIYRIMLTRAFSEDQGSVIKNTVAKKYVQHDFVVFEWKLDLVIWYTETLM